MWADMAYASIHVLQNSEIELKKKGEPQGEPRENPRETSGVPSKGHGEGDCQATTGVQ